jgi:hypothetical protein
MSSSDAGDLEKMWSTSAEPVALRTANHGSVTRPGQGAATKRAKTRAWRSSPPTALALAEQHNQMISDVFGIQTVSELRSNKYFAVAGVRVVLGNKI